ncbi:MAG: FtsQ-type POTRA domain-containing protein [Desulfotomaculaceae bacterium]|nr:FtsQ-type POTRA domain-containing protein [Desulfotomaculaceae bacterium]
MKVVSGSAIGPRRQRSWNIFESVFFIFLVLITGFILMRSPFFEVRSILVQGNQLLDQGKIKYVSDIAPGANIFKVDLAAAATRLKLIPMVKDVQVTRSLPSTVVIGVTERKPVGLLPTGEGFIEVDGEGVYLQKANAGAPGLPVVTGINLNLPSPGEVVKDVRLGDALTVISNLSSETVADLSEVHVDNDGQIRLYTIEGIQCRFGLAEDIQKKGDIFSQLLKELSAQKDKIYYIDLSCADNPVVFYDIHKGAI